MKSVSYIKSFYLLFAVLSVGITQSSWVLDPSNPPTAKTGAPGETTCSTSSGCHSGGNYTGTVTLTGIPDTVMPDQTYSLTLTMASTASRSGFEIVCLDPFGNTTTGTWTAGSGSNVATSSSNGRKYVRQSSAKSLSGGMVSWSFSWKAPASTSDNTAKFYYAMLAANGNGNKSGDNALTGNKQVVIFTPTVGTTTPSDKEGLRIFPNPASEKISVEVKDGEQGVLNIYNLTGKLIKSVAVNATTQIDISQFSKGTYLAQLHTEKRDYTSKFIVD